MNDQNVLIFKLPELYKILNELKNHLDFNIFSFYEKEKLLNSKKIITSQLKLIRKLSMRHILKLKKKI